MSFEELTRGFVKEHGKIGGKNFQFSDMPRIPTGWYPLDLALGGGIPQGKITEIYGAESSCKTSLTLKIIANHQKIYPKKKCAFFDIEHNMNSDGIKWAKKLGVDTDALYIFKPDYGESAIDMVEDLLGSPECGIVAVDSLAALLTTRELGKSAETRDVGGPAFLVTQLMRKVVGGLVRAEKEGHTPTFIGINQLRAKIGGYGQNPEDTAGGRALKYFCSLRLRLYGKDVKDAKYHKDLAVTKELNFAIKKHKFPIIATSGNDMPICMIPHKGLKVGECNDFGILKQYMEQHGVLVKQKNGKYLFNEEKEFGTLAEVKAMLDADVPLATEIKTAIIDAEKDKANRDGAEPTPAEDFDETTGEVHEDNKKATKAKKSKASDENSESEQE